MKTGIDFVLPLWRTNISAVMCPLVVRRERLLRGTFEVLSSRGGGGRERSRTYNPSTEEPSLDMRT